MKYVNVAKKQFLRKSNLKKLIIFIVLVFLDLISKYYIFKYVDLYQFIKITKFLDITHIHNFGVSFGLFSETIPSFALIIIAMFVVFLIIYLFLKSSDTIEKMGLFVIICGAMANIFDRLINGYVIDFIYFHINQFYWPAFNFADIYISIGIIMILFNMLNKIKK
tara:strand:- start:13887 stop:14381 length:495 start_codon:yes stop_codon:yes gene_type:complete